MSMWYVFFAVVLLIIWVIAGGFITQTNVYITPEKNTDDHFKKAWDCSLAASLVTWFLVAIVIILGVLSVIGVGALFGSGVGEAGMAAEAVESESMFSQFSKLKGQSSSISWMGLLAMMAGIGLCVLTGVLSAITASEMVKSDSYNADDHKMSVAYKNCVIAASLSLGAAGLLIIGMITYYAVKSHNKKKAMEHRRYKKKMRYLNHKKHDHERYDDDDDVSLLGGDSEEDYDDYEDHEDHEEYEDHQDHDDHRNHRNHRNHHGHQHSSSHMSDRAREFAHGLRQRVADAMPSSEDMEMNVMSHGRKFSESFM